MKIYVYKDGRKAGPYSLAQLNSFIHFGWVQAEDLAWFEGCPDWIKLQEVPGIQSTARKKSTPEKPVFTRPSGMESASSAILCKVCEKGFLIKTELFAVSERMHKLGLVLLWIAILSPIIFFVTLSFVSVSSTASETETIQQAAAKNLDKIEGVKVQVETTPVIANTFSNKNIGILFFSVFIWVGIATGSHLLMKKKEVLQCKNCQAVVNIS